MEVVLKSVDVLYNVNGKMVSFREVVHHVETGLKGHENLGQHIGQIDIEIKPILVSGAKEIGPKKIPHLARATIKLISPNNKMLPYAKMLEIAAETKKLIKAKGVQLADISKGRAPTKGVLVMLSPTKAELYLKPIR